MTLTWCHVANEGRGRRPKWLRTAAINEAGTVFVAAGMVGDEKTVMLCAMQDGSSMVTDGGHPYLPTTWIRRAYPDWAEVCQKIEERMRLTVGL